MLIDGGNNSDGPLLVKYFQELGIKDFKCSKVEDCKLLKDSYVSDFMRIITDFGIEIA